MDETEIAVKLENHERRLSEVERRVDMMREVQDAQNKLVVSVNKLALNMESMLAEQREQGTRLDTLEREPAQRWNSAMRTAFTTIVSVIAGALAVGLLQMIAANL